MLEVTTAFWDPFADLCHQQALLARPICSPNPAVGAVIVDSDNRIIGQGHTQVRGGPHAEIMALRDAAHQGNDVAGATLYVSLEPCCHQGRTGPCCDAIIAAGIRKVVAACVDPNPLVSGLGLTKLRAAGVLVELGDGGVQSKELNIGFFSRMVRKAPWVRTKIAATLDGNTALASGESQWITSEPARRDGHVWRSRADALLTGIGTIRHDNPRLDVRYVETRRQPLLAIVDSQFQTPPNAHVFDVQRSTLVYGSVTHPARQEALQISGATTLALPELHNENVQRVDLAAVMRDLGQREINELHVEAGSTLNGALVNMGLVDEFLVYLAPKLVGRGRDMLDWGPLASLAQALPLQFRSIDSIGPDLRIVARVEGRDAF